MGACFPEYDPEKGHTKMPRPAMRGAGRVVLIQDITRSDRERLPDWRDDGGLGCARAIAWCVVAWMIVLSVTLAWWFS